MALRSVVWAGCFGHEEVHLRALSPLFMDLKNHRNRLPQRHRSERLQELRMLRLIPLRREAIRRADNELVAFELQRLRRLQPGFESLFWQFLTRPIEQSRPCFLCTQSHNVESGVWKT